MVTLTLSRDDELRITITLDTNSIIDWANGKNPSITRIMGLHSQGKIVVVKTADAEPKSKIASKASEDLEDMGYMVIGSSRLNHTRIGDEGAGKEQDDILRLIFPGVRDRFEATPSQIREVMHLHTHKLHNRDFFVTKDGNIIQARSSLEKLAIVVRDPAEILADLESLGIK